LVSEFELRMKDLMIHIEENIYLQTENVKERINLLSQDILSKDTYQMPNIKSMQPASGELYRNLKYHFNSYSSGAESPEPPSPEPLSPTSSVSSQHKKTRTPTPKDKS
jgi:hypothetical protein